MPPATAKTDLMNLTLGELTDFIKQQGEDDFRGKQIFFLALPSGNRVI